MYSSRAPDLLYPDPVDRFSPPARGLTNGWRFSRSQGAHDFVGSHHGTITGATLIELKQGQALNFNGASNFVNTNATIMDGVFDFSASAKVIVDNNSNDRVIFWRAQGNFAGSGGIALFVDVAEGGSGRAKVFNFIINSGGTTFRAVTDANFVETGVFYSISCVARVGIPLQIWVNGKNETTFNSGGNWVGPLETNSSKFTIGATSGGTGRFFAGSIFDVLIHKFTALSNGAIQNLQQKQTQWDIYREPLRRNYFVPAVAGGGLARMIFLTGEM